MRKNIILIITAAAIGAAAMTGCSKTADNKATAAESTAESTTEESTEESSEAETAIGMPNQWTDSDEQGVLEATGLEIAAPEGATEVSYSYMEESKLAQVKYVLDDISWVYRMEPADELTDISGMYYEWTDEDKSEGTVSGREAVYYGYLAPEDSDEEDVQLVNWYDAVTGVTYSLSATAKDLDGMDIQAYAEQLYVPLQGDATDDPAADRENELKDYFLGEHTSSYDGSTLNITDKNDGTFAVNIDIFRLCSLEDGVGTFEDHKMYFDVDDPNGDKMSGVIYRDSDNSLTVKITESTWDYLSVDDTIEGFGR